MSDFVEKLKAHGWSRPLSMSHQKSEYKEEYDTKPNIKSELDRIDGQLPYLTQPDAPMTKVIFLINIKNSSPNEIMFRRYAKMNEEHVRELLFVHGIHLNKVFLPFLILI
jgi:hypothetical protein